ncbi:MAG: hypothetical protein AB8B91_00325 [Rubripirellula sp.]
MSGYTLMELGWQPFFARQLEEETRDGFMAALISAHHGSHVLMLTEQSEISVASRQAG